MLDRHRRRLPEREGRGRKHQERGRAALLRHAGNTRGFKAAVGPYAVDDRQPTADLVLRDVEDTALLVEGAGGTSVEWALTVIAEMPGVAATSRRCLRKLLSSIVKSSANGSKTAGMTPCGTYSA
jgi:hypothetical protein